MVIDAPGADSLTDTQRAILDALQRPLRDGGPYATPATNREIAAEVYLSVDAVKGHLRALYARLGHRRPAPERQARAARRDRHERRARRSAPAAAAGAGGRGARARSQRGRIPAMLSAVALGLVLLGVVVGLMLGHDGGDTIISQQPGFDEPGDAGKGQGGKGTLLGGLPGPWSDDGLFAAGPAVPAGYALTPGTAGAAPVSERTDKPAPRRTSPRRPASPRPRKVRAPAPVTPTAAPTVTTTPTPTRRARRTCTTRRQVTYRPRTVTVRRVRLRPQQVRRRVVRYRQEVRMVPVQRQVPNGNGNGNGKARRARTARAAPTPRP